MIKKNTRIATGTGLVLMIPVLLLLLAFWQWRPSSYILAVLLVAGSIYVTYGMFAKKLTGNRTYLFAVALAILSVLLLVWMSAAVGGILGDDPANMMYFGVLLVGLIGAVIAQLEPRGMSRAMFAMAFAMILVPAIGGMIANPAVVNKLPAAFGLHAVYAMLFAGSGLLFRKAVSR